MLLALAGFAKTAFGALVQWLSRRSLAEIICIALALLLTVDHMWGNHWKAQATSEHARRVSCQSGRAADRQAYANAQAQARAKNDQQLARVKSEQEAINARTSQSYEADLARLRSELGRLLNAKAAPGASGHSGSPDIPNAAPVADDPSRVSIPTGLYVRGAELELQLEALQNWIRQQAAVDPNK